MRSLRLFFIGFSLFPYMRGVTEMFGHGEPLTYLILFISGYMYFELLKVEFRRD